MTREEAIKRIEQMQVELGVLKSILALPKKRPRVKKDYSKQINKCIMKTPHLYK